MSRAWSIAVSARTALAVVVAAVPAVFALLPTPPAHAAFRAPCTPGDAAGPRCTWWNARLTFVADGDTIDARIAGVGTRRIRVTGINAMELSVYSRTPSRRRGACHAVAAAALVDRLDRRSYRRIRLAAQRATSHSRHRLYRSVWFRIGGRWVDLAREQLRAGGALWLPNHTEPAHMAAYNRLAQRALRSRRALADPDACGAGPQQDVPIGLTVNWDADGPDDANANGEWAEIRNGASVPLRLGGWWLRDSFLRWSPGRIPGHRFPAGTVVPPGGALRLRMGCGTASALERHWCQADSVFENEGDGGYLFDPDGDLRAAFVFPCVVACSDPLAGRIRLTAQPRGDEWIGITNTSDAPVDLGDHLVKPHVRGAPGVFAFGYRFAPGTLLAPGETMRVAPGGRARDDSRLLRHAGRSDRALADTGNAVDLRTADDQLTACVAWGAGRC
jgi:endonuclease YncB( thermonuclease family)